MRAALEPRILILCPLSREWSFLVKTFEASLHVERLHDLKIEAAYIAGWRARVAPGGHGKTQFALQAQYLIGRFYRSNSWSVPVQPGASRPSYRSLNDGRSWMRMGGGLPVVPVYDLKIKGTDLVAGTHGRSFWILDDITPLRA